VIGCIFSSSKCLHCLHANHALDEDYDIRENHANVF
jgi:hypothetical protein